MPSAELSPVRALSIVSAAGRALIGVGLLLAPRHALAALGFADPAPPTVTVARLAGGRDIALGLQTALALGDHERLRRAQMLNAGVDACDAGVFALALFEGAQEQRDAALRGLLAAVPAALGGAWAASRLRE